MDLAGMMAGLSINPSGSETDEIFSFLRSLHGEETVRLDVTAARFPGGCIFFYPYASGFHVVYVLPGDQAYINHYDKSYSLTGSQDLVVGRDDSGAVCISTTKKTVLVFDPSWRLIYSVFDLGKNSSINHHGSREQDS